jgi:hypothetical protein
MAGTLVRGHAVVYVPLKGWVYKDTGEPIHHEGPKNKDRPRFRFADQPKESLDKPVP